MELPYHKENAVFDMAKSHQKQRGRVKIFSHFSLQALA